MIKAVRYSLFFISAVQIIFAVAFFLQLPFAVALWPFPGSTPLTLIFVASFFAAAAASTLWAAGTETYGALAGIALDYVAIFVPVSIFLFQLGANGDPQFTAFGIACVGGAIFGIGLLLWSIRIPIDGTIPMPALVKGSFVVFVLALLFVSIRLLLQVPNVMPWPITPELSTMIGWMFFGAATYFAYGLLRPSWLNAAGQLAGFLAYDLVLIVPFLTRLPTVADEHRVGLIIYIVVVVYSGLLASYYLFVNPTTRLWRSLPSASETH